MRWKYNRKQGFLRRSLHQQPAGIDDHHAVGHGHQHVHHVLDHVLKTPGDARLRQGEHGVARDGDPVHRGDQIDSGPDDAVEAVHDTPVL